MRNALTKSLFRAARIWIFFALLAIGFVSGRGQSALPELNFGQAHADKIFTEFFRRTNGWAAGDVGTSVSLSDGRVLWLFGDSYVNQFDPKTDALPCLFDAHNAVLLQNTNEFNNAQTLLNSQSGDRSFFRVPKDDPADPAPWFWPAAGFQNGGTIYIYLAEIQSTPQGGLWGFKSIGQYWAKIAFPKLTVAGYTKLPSFNSISFGCGFVKDDKSGFTYAFGERRHSTASDVFVARFPTAEPEDPWTFWNGKGWDSNVSKARAIAQGDSSSVSVCKVSGKFLLLSTEFSVACDQGRGIFASVSDNPTGPFTQRKKIFTVDDAVQGHHPFFYLAIPHPEFPQPNNELLITYCINGYEPCVPNCVNGQMNPDYYRPRAIRLPLK